MECRTTPLIYALHQRLTLGKHPNAPPRVSLIGKTKTGDDCFHVEWHDGERYRVAVQREEG